MGSRGIGNTTAAANAAEVTLVDPVSGIPYGQVTDVGIVGRSTGATSQIAASVTAQTALAANAARKGSIFVNEPGATAGGIAYLLLSGAGTVSAANYTYALAPRETLELLDGSNFTGRIAVVFSVANGTLMITEITA